MDGKGDGAATASAPGTPRRSLLDLAPLELDCMNTLWPIGEGTVREIRDLLAPRRPRAYTTIMTIMDRLARKGVVDRRKLGRAYIYRPNLSAEEARVHALGQVVESFFGGSRDAAAEYLREGARERSASPRLANAEASEPARAAAAAAGAGSGNLAEAARELVSSVISPAQIPAPATAAPRRDDGVRIDETLL